MSITVGDISVMNVFKAIDGMRNPLNSWAKSDTDMFIGEKDLKLARQLVKVGTDHRKFLRQILVSMDITAPRFWWIEFDTYKVGTTSNSCSTMHTILNKEFALSDFSFDTVKHYIADGLVDMLNDLRDDYLSSKDKDIWRAIIEALPQSYNQKRTVTMNFEVLLNMYEARKNHKLDEWQEFCNVIENLPHFSKICL